MKALVACEFSGVVRDAFIRQGCAAVSCDLLDSERPGSHRIGDVRDILAEGWDLMIAHPPCTFLTNSGIRWLYKDGRKENGRDGARWSAMYEAADFYRMLWDAPIERICIENPEPMIVYAERYLNLPKAGLQVIQPW